MSDIDNAEDFIFIDPKPDSRKQPGDVNLERMKILKRVCTRFNNGVRKSFVLDGETYSFVSTWVHPAGGSITVNSNMSCTIMDSKKNTFAIKEITPDGFLTAFATHVHEK